MATKNKVQESVSDVGPFNYGDNIFIKAFFVESKEKSEAEMSLSVSKAKTFDDCKAKFKYNYIEKLPRKEWDFHVFGTFCHDILETFHQSLIDNPEQEFSDVIAECFKNSVEKFKEKLSEEQKKEAHQIVSGYIKQMYEDQADGKLPNVIAVERSFYIDINGKVLLNGFIDRVQIDPDGVLHVTDYKTTKDKKYLKDYFQLLTYAYVLMLEDPSIERVRTSFMLLRHDCDQLVQEYTRKDVAPIAEKFLKYAKEIDEEKLWRPQPQFLCKFCDFLENCDAGNKFLIKRGVIKESSKKETFGLGKW